MKKRILSLILVFSLLITSFVVLPITASAAKSGSCGTNLKWSLDDDGLLTISGTGSMTNWKSYEMAPWWGLSTKSVIIENGITHIGNFAFSYCYNLTEVNIPDSVTSIGEYAFNQCTGLNKITIPDGVKSISKRTFSSCTSLTSISIPDSVTSIGEGAFSNCSALGNVMIPNSVISIGDSAFGQCSSLISVTIPDSVTSIGRGPFCRCTNLISITVDKNNKNYVSIDGNLFNKNKTVLIQYALGKTDNQYIIPESVTSIGDFAFSDCDSLTSIKISNSVTTINDYAFVDCDGLTSITIPNSVTSMYYGVFSDCDKLTSITIPDGITRISPYMFVGCDALTRVAIPDSVTSIGDSAFKGCSNLTNIAIPNKVTSIGTAAFSDCSKLTRVTIPSNVTIIRDSTFVRCTALTDVTISNKTVSIGWYAFLGCSGLTNITIPDTLKSVGNYAFSNCSSLTEVYYTGNESQWKSISIGSYNLPLTNATIHFSSNTPVSVHKPYTNNAANTNNMVNNINNNLNSLLSNVTLCDTTVYGPTVNIFGRDFCPLKFDANAVLNLAGLSKNITIDEDKKTVHVILGKKNVNGQASVVQTTKMCDASWSKQYNEIKDLYKTMTGFDMKGSSGGVNNWNRFEKMKAQLNHLKCDFIIDADMSVLGYLDFDYQTGNLKFKEGGLIETASLGMQLKHGTILYAVLSLKGTEKGTIKAQVSSSGKIEPYMSLAPSLTAMAKLGGNIGIAKIEGGIDATLAMLLQTVDPKFKVSMSGDLFVYGSSPVFNKTLFDKKYPYLNCELYPEFKNNLSASTYSLRAASVGITEDSLDVQPMDRSYLYAVSLMSVTDENSIYTLNSVYPQNNAQLVRLAGDSMMLVWTGDNGTKSDINRSSLMYSIYKNGVWSETQTINEDGTATGDFRAVTDGTDVYIVYQKMNKVLDDNAELEEGLKEVDLYYTQYANGGFSEPVRITDNNELFEVIGDVSITDNGLNVVWAENSENNITFSNGTNTIKEYTANKTVKNISELTASSEEYIGDVCVGGSGVYYTVVNSADGTSVIYKYDGTVSQAFASDAIISDLKEFGGKMYYIKNSALYSYDGNTESETGIDEISDFRLVSNGNDIAVLASVFDGKGSELYISKLEDGAWSQKERFTDLGKYIRSYSPFMYSDGTINVAVSAADINSLDDGNESVYGNTSIMVLNQCDYFDAATSYLYYEGDIAPNNKIDLYFDITNDSSSELNSINVKLTDANQNTLDSRTISCSIAPYATEVLSIPYTLPDDIKLTELSVEISADKAEKDYSNNKASVSYGYANIKVLPVSYKLNSNNTAEINTTIKNEGFTDAENVVITVYNGNNNEDILEEKSIGNLNIGDSYELNYTFPEELMVSNEEDVMNAVYVVATTSSDESIYSDNEEKVTFDSSICRIDDITIDGTNINVQFTKNFDEKVLLVVASYTDDDRLCSVTYDTVNLTDTKNFALHTNGASYVSAFLWKDIDNLTPLCNKLSKNIEQ